MNAIVTGASSGIGQAIAQALVDRGDRVFAVGNETTPEGWSRAVCVDLTHPAAPEFVVERAIRALGCVDALVNAAGILRMGAIVDANDESWDEVFAINFTAVRRLMKAAYPSLSTVHGAVVNVSSINADRPFAGTAAYSASKAALDQLTRVAAVEWAPRVRVNAVNPGVVVTSLHRRAGVSEEDYETFLARCRETHPLGRSGTPDDVASAVVFLLTHPWITGVTLPVDGGRHLTVVR